MRIAHISDVHIRNHIYHNEYSDIFEKLYKSLRSNNVDLIVNTGDLVHQKLSLSPSVFKMSLEFTKEIASIAPLYMIIGNHDMNLRNKSKMDILSSVVDSINAIQKNDNIVLFKESGYHNIIDNIDFGIYSLLDEEEEWPIYSNSKNISIALYHGIVEGTVADGFTFSNATPAKKFEEYDYCMLGHVHNKQKVFDKPLTWYCGSLIQQNFGEDVEKGYIIWDIKSKTQCNIEHIDLKNPSPFITVNFSKDLKIDDIPKDSKLRIKYNLLTNKKELNDFIFKLKRSKYCKKVVPMKKREDEISSINNTQTIKTKDQSEYIKDYLIDTLKIKDQSIIDQVMDLNMRLDKKFETNFQNGQWSIQYLKWSNTFNYGSDNILNFNDFNDIVGIFGKNFSGKTSIVDTLLFSIFGKTSKESIKTAEIINNKKKFCKTEIKILYENEEYHIKRRIDRTKTQATTKLNFYKINRNGHKKSLNDETKPKTEKNIEKMFGTVGDFLLTTMQTQFGNFNFFDEGPTKKLEIIARFLNLSSFDLKYKEVMQTYRDAKTIYKSYPSIQEMEASISENKNLLEVKRNISLRLKESLSEQKEQKTSLDRQVIELDRNLKSFPKDLIAFKGNFENNQKNIKNAAIISESIERTKKTLNDSKLNIENIDIDSLKKNKTEYNGLSSDLEKTRNELRIEKKRLDECNRNEKTLKCVPCNGEYSDCEFIKYACKNIKEKQTIVNHIESLNEAIEATNNKIKSKNINKINKQFQTYSTLSEKINKTQDDIIKLSKKFSALELEIEKFKMTYKNIDGENIAKQIENINGNKRVVQSEINERSLSIKRLSNKIINLVGEIGGLEEKIKNDKKKKKEYDKAKKEYYKYKYFLKCMHPKGVPFEIIKQNINSINSEIEATLEELMYEFSIYLEINDEKLNIYFKNRDEKNSIKKSIYQCSGSEKTIATTVLRLALSKISNIPISDIIFFDEPGTAFDQYQLDEYTKIINALLIDFKTVIMITHIDSLKDICNKIINITKKKSGNACVKV